MTQSDGDEKAREVMALWVIFLASALIIAVVTLIVIILAHRTYMMIQRDEMKLEKEKERAEHE